MRASSLQQRYRSLSNVFVQRWRRWIAARADQLFEISRLGSDKLEYLTCAREMSNSDPGMVAGGRGDDSLRRRMLAQKGRHWEAPGGTHQ